MVLTKETLDLAKKLLDMISDDRFCIAEAHLEVLKKYLEAALAELDAI